MRRQRLLTITLVSFLLLFLTVICANASWFIQDKNKESGSATNVGIALQEGEQNPIFQTTYTYTGNVITLEYLKDAAGNSIGQSLFGNASENLEIVCNSATASGSTRCTEESLKSSFNSFMKENGSYVIKNAGTYQLSITDKTTGQIIFSDLKVVVNPIQLSCSEPTPTAPTFEGEYGTATYQMQYTSAAGTLVTLNTEYTVTTTAKVAAGAYEAGAKNTNTPPAASASMNLVLSAKIPEKLTFSDGTTSANSTFNNYLSPATTTVSKTFLILPTTYSVSGDTTTYWGSITTAINGTSSGTIYPMQQVSYGGKTYYVRVTGGATPNGSYVHEITADCEIKPGVTMTVPFGTDVSQTQVLTYHVHSADSNGACTSSCVHRPNAYNNNKATWYTNAVTLKAGIELTNNGTINVSGTISGGAGGYNQNSITAGLHARLMMESGATINSNGTINCWGFIDEEELGNGSFVNVNSGILNTVFTINEHRGGSIYMGAVNPTTSSLIGALSSRYTPTLTCVPFSRFYIQSVVPSIRIQYGAAVNGYVDLYANEQHNESSVTLIGKNSKALIQLSSGSYAINKFDPINQKHDLDIYGNAKLNSLTLNIDVTYSGLTAMLGLSSRNTFFPLSYHWDINLKVAQNATSANVDISYQDIKLLPGSSLVVDKGVTLAANSIAVYESNNLLTASAGSVAAEPYTNSTPANLTVNGILNVVNLGGKVTSTTENAVINITGSNSVISKEIINTQDASLTINVLITSKTINYKACIYSDDASSTLTATGSLLTVESDGTQTVAANTTLPTGGYYSVKTASGEYAWRTGIKGTITLNANGGAYGSSETTNTEVFFNANGAMITPLHSLTHPLKSGNRVSGWSLNAASSTETLAENVRSGDVLYAIWREALPATVTYNVTAPLPMDSEDSVIGSYTAHSWSDSENATLWVEDGIFIVDAETLASKNSNSTSCNKFISGWFATWTIVTSEDDENFTYTVEMSYAVGDAVDMKAVRDLAGISDPSLITSCSATLTPVWSTKHTLEYKLSTKRSGLVSTEHSVSGDGGSFSAITSNKTGTLYLNPLTENTITVYGKGGSLSFLGSVKCKIVVDGSEIHNDTGASTTTYAVTVGGKTVVHINQ